MVKMVGLDYAKSLDGGACSRNRTVGWPPCARPTLARTPLTHHLASKAATSKLVACCPAAAGNQLLRAPGMRVMSDEALAHSARMMRRRSPTKDYATSAGENSAAQATRRSRRPQTAARAAMRRVCHRVARWEACGCQVAHLPWIQTAGVRGGGLPPSTRTQRRATHSIAGLTAGHSNKAWRSVSSRPAVGGLRAGWGRHAL